MNFQNFTEGELQALIKNANQELEVRKSKREAKQREQAINTLKKAWKDAENSGVRISTQLEDWAKQLEDWEWYELKLENLYFD